MSSTAEPFPSRSSHPSTLEVVIFLVDVRRERLSDDQQFVKHTAVLKALLILSSDVVVKLLQSCVAITPEDAVQLVMDQWNVQH